MSNLTIEQALELDVKSEEFFEIYKAISDKYWTFDDPDELQKCAALMVKWAQRFDEDKIILATKLIIEISKMAKEEVTAASLHVAFSNIEYYVDIASSEIEKDKLKNQLKKVNKAMKSGNIEIKDKFGKKYF